MGSQVSEETRAKVNASAVEWQSEAGEQQWWRTAPLTVDSWAYSADNDSGNGSKIRIPPHNYLVSLTSAVHLGSGDVGSADSEGLRLNPGLVGVRIVEDAVQPYEKAVGFPYVLFPTIEKEDWGPFAPMNLKANEDDILENNRAWAESLKDFISSVQEMPMSDNEDSLANSFVESEPSSGSDNSMDFFAMPATPVFAGSTLSDSDVLIKTASPNSTFSSASIDEGLFSTPAPSKRLNAFASSFVPSFSPPAHSGIFSLASITDSLEEKKTTKPSSKNRETESKIPLPSLSSFTFPTLNPPTKSTARLTTVKIKRDDQGFFTDVHLDKDSLEGKLTAATTPMEQPQQASTTESQQLLLPPFLQEPTPRRRARASRTREIVDRLRSNQSEAPSPLSLSFDDVPTDSKDAISPKASLDFPFDLMPKSASASQSPSPIFPTDGAVMRPRSSISEYGPGQRSDIYDGRDSRSQSGLSTPSLAEDEEGWIDLGASSFVTSLSTAKRARDLFLAFTRRRTDSISSEPAKERLTVSEHAKTNSVGPKLGSNGERDHVKEKTAKPIKAPKRPNSASRDGWFEGTKTPKPSTATERETKSTAAPQSSGSVKLGSAPLCTKPVQRKKPSHSHRHQSSSQNSIPLSSKAPAFSPSQPVFPTLSNPPYLNVPGNIPVSTAPLVNPNLSSHAQHMGMMPAPAPVPASFFFNPATPAYHPVSLGGTGLAGVSPMPGVYAPVPVPMGFVPVRVPASTYGAPPIPSIVPHAGSTHHRKGSSTLSAW